MGERQSNMATFRMRAVNSRDIVGTLIDIVSDSFVDHVEFDCGTGWLGAHSSGGVQIRPYDYMTPSLEYIFELEVSEQLLVETIARARALIGTPYNFGAIFGILFHDSELTESDHFICSQYTYEILRMLGFEPLNKDLVKPNMVTPGALILSPI